MRQARAAVGQAVADSLIDGHSSSRGVEPNGPRRCQRGLGRKIEAEGDAEFALFTIGVLLEFGSAEIRGEIDVRRLKWLSGDGAESGRDLMMEEPRHRFVVRDIAARTLGVTEINGSSPDQMAIVAAQSRQVEGMDEISQGCIPALAKHRGRFVDSMVQDRSGRGFWDEDSCGSK